MFHYTGLVLLQEISHVVCEEYCRDVCWRGARLACPWTVGLTGLSWAGDGIFSTLYRDSLKDVDEEKRGVY